MPLQINFNQLRAFHQAATYLNFSKAAKKMCITQPAVTAQIKTLEDFLDLKLFSKKGGKLLLTDAGQTIFQYSKKIFDHEIELIQAIKEIKQLKRGTLRLGTARTYAKHFIPFLISGFHESYPQVTIQLDEGNSLEMIKSVRELKNELAVVARTDGDADISFLPFRKEPLSLIVAPEHPLAKKGIVLFKEIVDEPLIMKETGSGTRRLVEQLFADHRIHPKILMETSDGEMIKLLVRHGDGISFLAEGSVAHELKEETLKTVALKGVEMFLEVGIGYLTKQPLSIAAKAFVEHVEKMKDHSLPFGRLKTTAQ
jgi:LysR family transcriptional regulator, low CO2-responsive transcriptional regulator